MRYKEWVVILIFVAIAITASNFIAFHVPIASSIIGVLILCAITILAVFLSKFIPLKLPMIFFCSLLGLLFAMPASPVSELVTEATGKIEFKAPLTIVGVLAGISIGASFHEFRKQGIKMFVLALVIMTSTFLGSVLVAQVVLKLTGEI